MPIEIKKFYNEFSSQVYQFLDKPHPNLFLDVVFNQLNYPYHCVLQDIERYKYCAKKKWMYTDLLIYDECRYIYEWLPTIQQMETAFKNLSVQYVFRFALDGLVKQREKYNSDFFYQGSIITSNEEKFKRKEIMSRINLNKQG